MTKISKKQLRKEHAVMLRRYHLFRGLAILSDLRIREYVEVMQELGLKKTETQDDLMAVRELVSLKYMNNGPKARMLLDAYREIDIYIWGPLELCFCAAHVIVERYNRLKKQYPVIALPDLDNYLIDNQAAFEAVKQLRDWALHPGYFRVASDAMKIFDQRDGYRHYGNLTAKHPSEILFRLFGLFQQLLDSIHEHAR